MICNIIGYGFYQLIPLCTSKEDTFHSLEHYIVHIQQYYYYYWGHKLIYEGGQKSEIIQEVVKKFVDEHSNFNRSRETVNCFILLCSDSLKTLGFWFYNDGFIELDDGVCWVYLLLCFLWDWDHELSYVYSKYFSSFLIYLAVDCSMVLLM